MEQLLLPIVMFGALGAMMFFGMRKQKRQVAAVKAMQDQLGPGARVMTTSGLHATVTAVADDTIELEIAPGLRTTWVRAAVREVVVSAPAEETFDESGYDQSEYDETDTTASDGASPYLGNGQVNLGKSDFGSDQTRKNVG
jgi:preprotein translocase subunit YajC